MVPAIFTNLSLFLPLGQRKPEVCMFGGFSELACHTLLIVKVVGNHASAGIRSSYDDKCARVKWSSLAPDVWTSCYERAVDRFFGRDTHTSSV